MTQSSRPAGWEEILARLNDRMNVLEQEMQALRAQATPSAAPPEPPGLSALEARAEALLAKVEQGLAEFRSEVGALASRADEAEARLQRAVTAANLLIGRGGGT